MDNVPLEVLVRHASHEVGKYFAEKVELKRKEGYVAVILEDFTHSLYFVKCDKSGYPDYHYFRYATLDPMSVSILADGAVPEYKSVTVEEISVMLEKPLLSARYDYRERPAVFLWQGRKMGREKIPLEKLNVSELLKLAQQAVINREGLVIDEALKNKIYK